MLDLPSVYWWEVKPALYTAVLRVHSSILVLILQNYSIYFFLNFYYTTFKIYFLIQCLPKLEKCLKIKNTGSYTITQKHTQSIRLFLLFLSVGINSIESSFCLLIIRSNISILLNYLFFQKNNWIIFLFICAIVFTIFITKLYILLSYITTSFCNTSILV